MRYGSICEDLLFVQLKAKICRFKRIFSLILKIIQNSKGLGHKVLLFLASINILWDHVRSHTKFGPDRFSRLLVTKRKTYTLQGNVTSSIRNIPPPDKPTFRPTAISDLRQQFIFVLFEGQVRLKKFLGRAPRLGGRAPRLGGRALRPKVHLAAVKPRASRSDVKYSGFVVGHK